MLRRRLTARRAARRDPAIIDDTLAQGVPELFLIEEEYRLTLLDAESSFVERFIGQITDPEAGWGPLWAEFHGEPASSEERRQA